MFHPRDYDKMQSVFRSQNLRIGELSALDLHCLQPMEWLNDEVINAYVAMINDTDTGLKCFCWNTFFYTTLRGTAGGMSEDNYDYNKVRRWTKRKKIDIFGLDLMLLPLHVNHVHWCLGVVDFRTRLILYFDPLGQPPPSSYVSTIRRYLSDEWNDKKRMEPRPTVEPPPRAVEPRPAESGLVAPGLVEPRPEELRPEELRLRPVDLRATMATERSDGWSDLQSEGFSDMKSPSSFNAAEFLFAGNNYTLSALCPLEPTDGTFNDVCVCKIPLQNNGSDCGVFSCIFMRELAFNRYPFHFSHKDIPVIRLTMVLHTPYLIPVPLPNSPSPITSLLQLRDLIRGSIDPVDHEFDLDGFEPVLTQFAGEGLADSDYGE
ncbi:putative Ulp1 protease [Gregarina niphandrodes]|uniref:Ulp1 protease n=1 Tax=Gregarina niphandrodes TaxID=110365 RepID=A0A023BCS5_GRENI|nr:putative Ulp1 protease [Gregarina niphandrodes]EZG85834.1 putative Ulp1 protease [Gregarina niphandrodes]|eukprot:XP_011128811.1 putative Ulp1 protease [Gregarina niphandrodes]